MIYAENNSIKALIMHRIGNKSMDEGCIISDRCIHTNSQLTALLTKYFITPFITSEFYHLYHEASIELNEIYNYVSKIFNDFSLFQEQSINIARHLYKESMHPKIKAGELYVVYFQDCIVNKKNVDAIGVFKSENKDVFLKVCQTDGGFDLTSENGINVNKLDKGCLIFNTEQENGYLVAVVDNTNKGADAKYWTDDFLHVRPRKDSFNQTQNMLSLCKNFVSQLSDNNSKVEKATYMNRSVEALKDEFVNVDAFAERVFATPKLVSEFKQYKEAYQQERDIEIDDTFETASTAIKRRIIGTMTTIKLDKNFDINIHGGEQYIERGYDEKRKMHYYRLFFKEEK